MEETELESTNFAGKSEKKKRVLEDKACEVCGDKSTGKHYGVFSCDGCSGFYKRTCRRTEPWLCKGQGDCPVDKSSRNDCKACRLKKCIEIGMNFEGVYRRFRFNEELVKSPSAENSAENTPNDMRVDVTPPSEAQGYSAAIPPMRVQTKSVMVKTEDEQQQQFHQQIQQQQQQQQQQQPQQQQTHHHHYHHHQQQQQQQQQIQTTELENNQRRPASPKYYEESQGEEYLVQRTNSLPANKDHSGQAHPYPFPNPQTTVSAPPASSPVRITLVSQSSHTNARPCVTAPSLSCQRFQPPLAFSSIQQNGHTSPPRSVSNVPTQEPVMNGHRMSSAALASFNKVQRHLQPSQMTMIELHQAVEPLSFHKSEPLHDAATRLLTVSLRFGRRLPCFRRLPFRDQVILLEEGWKETLLLDSVFWGFSLSSGGSPEAENCPREQQVKTVQEALLPLRTLKLDSSEYACLKAVILFRTNTHGLKAADQVEQLQDEAQLLLADYVWSRLPTQPARFGKILLSVAVLRSLAEKPIEHLFFSAVPAKDMFESILSQVISSN